MPSKSTPSPIHTSTDEPEAPEILEYTAYPVLRKLKLNTLISERDQLREQRAKLDGQIRTLDQKILPAMFQAEARQVLCGHYQIQVVEQHITTLSKLRLVELGVSTDIIEQATEKKAKAPYILVTDLDKPNPHYTKKEK